MAKPQPYTHAGGRGQGRVRGESSRASVASIAAWTPPGATANSLCCLRSRPSSAACQQLHGVSVWVACLAEHRSLMCVTSLLQRHLLGSMKGVRIQTTPYAYDDSRMCVAYKQDANACGSLL